ncbi:MAG: LPS export ABC transporter periplasmic protein LptC [Roseovarius sp.]
MAWIKIILPLTALGLLSTLFLVSRKIDPTQVVSTSKIDIEQRAQDLGATNPRFAGVTKDGDEIRFLAEFARPDRDAPEHLIADGVTAQLRLSAGTVIDITSVHAEMQQGKMTASLTGQVHITTSTGYDITTERLNTRLDELHAETPGQVAATGPLGTVTAGRMLLRNNTESAEPELLFMQGVKLIYQPGKPGE